MIISYRENGEADSYALVDQEGRWLMTLLHNGSQVTQAQRDNLHRMVACWNAFDGMTTESIEALPGPLIQGFTVFDRIVADQKALLSAAVAARSALATALKANAPDWFQTEEDIAAHLTIKRLDAAIANATHGAVKPC